MMIKFWIGIILYTIFYLKQGCSKLLLSTSQVYESSLRSSQEST